MQSARSKLHRPRRLARLPLSVAICLACSPAAWAQQADPQAATDNETQGARTLDTITVTAQKRSENLQDVPISIQAIGNEKLEQQQVSDFDDYAKLIPSLSYGTAGGGVFSGPGFVQVYMRGVASGGGGNHSASQPSVGIYLDEQPITTIQGALDIHMYDIERVEALAGPQGTLYGASSQSGTVRIITRKPDPSGYAASYSLEASAIEDGGIGHVAEGMVNIPIAESAAVRLVGWEKHDAGYVDNVAGSRQYPVREPPDPPSWGGVVSNEPGCVPSATVACSGSPEEDYNEADTYGARAALRINLNDSWTITPSIIGQKQKAYGSTGFDPSVGDLAVTHFYPESSDDRWTQAALTVEGRIGNFDVIYAGSHLDRDIDSESDYNDYAFWYDTLAAYGAYFYDNDGALINPSQYIQAKDGYRKTSHEFRVSSPQEYRWRLVAGLFWQQHEHDIFQRYRVDNLNDGIEVSGWPDTIWLTSQQRRDRDEAVFGELSFDVTDKLTLTGGGRWFRNNNSLKGFFGYGAGFSGSTGEAACFSDEPFQGAPCTNLDKRTSENGSLGRFNATYKIDDERLVYITWSEGYRPGGINRRGTLPPYLSDFLTNYEVGWKTSWLDDRLIFNGAVFRQEWEDFQFDYLGQNGLTEIKNANQAQIDGVEMDLNWAATYNLQLSGGFAWYDAKLTEDYCGITDADGNPITECDAPEAREGDRLAISPKFKGNANARYTFNLGTGEAYWQVALSYLGDRRADMRRAQSELLGDLDAFTQVDLSAGYRRDSWAFDVFLKNASDERGELSRFSQCAALTCGFQPYTVVTQPRTLGVRFTQTF
jgi:iron complex outermembrane receptor protein